MTNETKKVQKGQTTIEETTAQEEPKPAANPAPVNEPAVNPEIPVTGDVKTEEHKTNWRKLADWADARDKKNAERRTAKQAKKEQKQKEKETSTTGSKLKKAGLIILGIAGAVGAGAVALAATNQSNDGVTYVDNGTPTVSIPEQTQSSTVEETKVEPAVAESVPSESAGTVVESTSNE